MSAYMIYDLDAAVAVLVLAIIVFEALKYFFGGKPDIIVMGVEDEEDVVNALKKSFQKAMEEKNSDSEHNKDR